MNAQLSASATAARAHQEMFAYWASLRRGASLPSRVDLHPSGIKRNGRLAPRRRDAQ